MKRSETTVEIGGRELTLSNLEKVMYPEVGFTKGDIIDYYAKIAPVLLPHLKDRPLTLKRYPNGVKGPFFYEKSCPRHRPKWVQTADIYSHGRGEDIPFCLSNDLPTLIWAANLADLELHTSLSKHPDMTRPTAIVFDLDPGAPADILQCCEVAVRLRHLFEALGLDMYVKTSGSKGLQTYVPLNSPVHYDQTKAFARAVAQLLEQQSPDLVTSNMKKSLRVGKIFVDWSQNDEHKTTVNVYSLRAKDRPTVSTPVEWREVERALKTGRRELLVFEAEEVLKRVKKKGDLFAPLLEQVQKLPSLGSKELSAAGA